MTKMSAPRTTTTGALYGRLAVLGSALFVYLTAELFPIGALGDLAVGLRVAPATAGLLLTAYAIAAGAATLPAVWASRRLDRRSALTVSLVLLSFSQLVFGLAPNFTVAALARGVAAAAHGLVWSQIPVVAARYAPEGERGRATAVVFAGSSVGLIAGAPIATGLAHEMGWRAASIVLAGVAGAIAVLLRVALPETPPPPREVRTRGTLRAGTVLVVCLVTIALVVGHYVSYTYLALLVAPAGLSGSLLVAVLAGYGIAGLLGVSLVGHMLDAHPRRTALTVAMTLTCAVTALGIAHVGWIVFVLVMLWGTAAAALPVILQHAVLRTAPDAPEIPSGAYVVSYQLGITGGSALGAALLSRTPAASLPLWSGIALAAGTILISTAPAVFGSRHSSRTDPAPARPTC
ncbi:MFS transporter [Nocardia miyunensis]|uniref:MFS transporter n=1 Tax=Nocardia miyunensis TaxID=282684 RepID=UPI000A015285|nr:MFS transporter [Nocardia miyunensis]